jgi:uncharacterized coiled-coil protein SlyX
MEKTVEQLNKRIAELEAEVAGYKHINDELTRVVNEQK